MHLMHGIKGKGVGGSSQCCFFCILPRLGVILWLSPVICLQVERRKNQRELREAQTKSEELETTNKHLEKRLEKLKTAKSNLLQQL